MMRRPRQDGDPGGALRKAWALRHDAIGAVAYWSGAGRAFQAAVGASGAIILMYHSVADEPAAAFVDPPNRISPALFERQMAFLRAHRRVVSLTRLVDDIAAGATPPAGTVALTFDDGYLDNLTVAAPILERYGLEATLFLATGYVDRAESQWADVLHATLTRRTRHRLLLPAIGLDADLRTGALALAVRRLHRELLEAQYPRRAELLAEVRGQLLPEGDGPRLTLRWDEVRTLRDRYPFVEIGAHTRDHVDLRTHPGAARAEVEGCLADVRRELGTAPRHFSYPYGRSSPAARDVVAALCGSAVCSGAGLRAGAGSDPFGLARVGAPRTMTELRFKTSGAFPGVLSALGLRSVPGFLAAVGMGLDSAGVR